MFYIGAAKPGMTVNNGHTAAIAAVKEQIEKAHKGDPADLEIVTKNINDFSNFSPVDLVRMEEEYIALIKNSPAAYTEQYKLMKETRGVMDPLLFETNFKLGELANYLDGTVDGQKADVVIGAHWLIPLALAQIKQNGRIQDSKLGWIFTDYYDNPLFPKISQAIDMTFLGAQELQRNLVRDGVDNGQLWTSGIPISPKAMEKIDANAYKLSKGLSTDPDTVTITLAGGGEGLGDFPTIVSQIKEKFKGKKVQVVAITAKNEEHFKNLTKLNEEWVKEVGSGFTLKIEKTVPNEDMLNYVKSSDLYIVKSGGLSPTEGAVIGKPMVLLDVLGGHERDNADFYEKIGIGVVNHDPNVIGDQIASLFDGESGRKKIEAMLQAQEKFRNSRDFGGVSAFALSDSPAKNNLLAKLTRSAEREALLKEIGLGSRDELHFLKEGQKLLKAARTAYKDGKKDEALQILKLAEIQFNKSLIINPGDYPAYFMLGHVQNIRGQYEKDKGNNEASKKEYEKGLAFLKQSLKYDPTHGQEGQHFHCGLHLMKLQRNGEAIHHMTLAADHPLYKGKANAKRILERLVDELGDEAVAQKVPLTQHILKMARELDGQENMAGAIYLYKRAIEKNPDKKDASIHLLLGKAYKKEGKSDLAIQALIEGSLLAKNKKVKSRLLLNIAKIYSSKGDEVLALNFAQKARDEDPSLPEARECIKDLDSIIADKERADFDIPDLSDVAEATFQVSGFYSGTFRPTGELFRKLSEWKKVLEDSMSAIQSDQHEEMMRTGEAVMGEFCSNACQENPLKSDFFKNYLNVMGETVKDKLIKLKKLSENGEGLAENEMHDWPLAELEEIRGQSVLKELLVAQICSLEAELKRCTKDAKLAELRTQIQAVRKGKLKANCHFERAVEYEREQEDLALMRPSQWQKIGLPVANIISSVKTEDFLNANATSEEINRRVTTGLSQLQKQYDEWMSVDRKRRSIEKIHVVKKYLDKAKDPEKFKQIKSDPNKLMAAFREIERRALTLPPGHSERKYFENMASRLRNRTIKRIGYMNQLRRLEENYLSRLEGTPYHEVFEEYLQEKEEKMLKERMRLREEAAKGDKEGLDQMLLPADFYKGPSEQRFEELYK